MSARILNRFTKAALVCVLLAAAVVVTNGTANAAAPGVTHLSTTTLTTSGRTALTYTGYMNGESFQ